MATAKTGRDRNRVVIEYHCNNCNNATRLQAVFSADEPLMEGCSEFPDDGILVCSECGAHHNLTETIRDLELTFWEKLKHPKSK